MPALPAATNFTGSSITEAQFKTAMMTLRSYLSGLLGDAGTIPAAQDALDVIFGAGVTAKSGSYTVEAGDRGRLINCTGTWTLSLLAAATAGAGFAFAVRNSGTGVITIDGGGAELVDGAATITLTAGSSAVIVCDGTGWLSVGRDAILDYVKHDHGHNNIGSLCFAGNTLGAATTAANPGGTVAGSALKAACINIGGGGIPLHASTLSGTWKCLGWYRNTLTGAVEAATLWQRIA